MRIGKLLFGLATLVPGLRAFRAKTTGGTIDAAYCYAVWLRHLKHARAAGLPGTPRVVAELGPGDSLGIGLCALLTGSERYVALDRVPFANAARNVAVLHELADLLRRREPVPGPDRYPRLQPALDDLSFPADLLPEREAAAALAPARVDRLAEALWTTGDPDGPILYVAPWDASDAIPAGTVDFLVSQAVLEHVDELEDLYRAMARWLRPGGWMSHQIDFKSHGVTSAWNGHWTLSDRTWRLMRGGRPYLLNRRPYSAHRRLLAAAGFEVVNERLHRRPSAVARRRLQPRFAELSDDDLTTAGAFVQAVRPGQDGDAGAGADGRRAWTPTAPRS